jgi:hypothetical protein
MQVSGVIQQAFAAGSATPSTLTMVVNQIPFGGATGLLTQSAKLTWNDTAAAEAFDISGVGTAGNLLYINIRQTTAAGVTSFGGVKFFYATGTQAAQILMTHIGGSTNAFTASVSQSAAGAEDQFVASGVAAGGQPPLIVWTQNKDVALGASAKNAAAGTRGFVWLPTTTAPPTGVPTLDGGAITSARKATILDDTNFRLYGYMAGAWRFVSFDGYSATPTRVPFGGAVAGTQTDDAAFFYTSATGILRAPLVESNTLGGFGGGLVLTLENNHAAPTSSMTLTATDIQVTVPAVSGFVPTAANTSIGTAANYWGAGYIGAMHSLSIVPPPGNTLALQGDGGAVCIVIGTDAVSITPAPGLQAETAANAQVGTLLNLPTATGGGDPDKFFQVLKAGVTYVIPAWAV